MRALLIAATLVAACTSLDTYDPQYHVVRRGETLYQIAWEHGLDQRDLARWNGLRNPDLIQVGQRLRLTSPPGAAATPTANGAPARGAAAPPSAPAARPAQPAPRTAPPAAPPDPPPAWTWPTDGQVVSRFGSAQGIATGVAIGGRVGQRVNAAAVGRVVYAGSGLIGYGQLVIIKHNETYLSAYGHLSRVLVAQGQDVGRGQEIAAMGVGPERQPRLHFEIRRNGVPIDPLQLVARR
jgi:lipoprotein NlpD